MGTYYQKFNVCTECFSVEPSDFECICCYSNEYETIELEFEVCNCCNKLIDNSPAETDFNKNQMNKIENTN